MSAWLIAVAVVFGMPCLVIGALVVIFLYMEWRGRPAVPPSDGPTMIGAGDPLYGWPPANDVTQMYRDKQ